MCSILPVDLAKKAENEDETSFLTQRWTYYNTNPSTKNENVGITRAKCLRDLQNMRKNNVKKETPQVSGLKTLSDLETKNGESLLKTPLVNPWTNNNNNQPKTLADMGIQMRGISQAEMDHIMSRGNRYALGNGDVSRDMNGAPEPTRNGMYDSCYTMGLSSGFLEDLVSGKRNQLHFGDKPWDCDDLFRCLIFIQRHTGGDVQRRERLTNELLTIPGLSPYWKALFSRWTYLTNEVLYSNRLSIDTISNMMAIVMGWSTKDFGFLTNRTITPELNEEIRLATNEVNEAWNDYNWNNHEACFRLIGYIVNRDGVYEAVPNGVMNRRENRMLQRFADILNDV